MANVRTKWCNHLSVSEEDLRSILKSLRIIHNSDGSERLTEHLSFRLQSAGIQPISDARRASVFTDLIQKLHAENKKIFTKKELLDILRQEQLLVETSNAANESITIGIRSFKRGTDTIAFETEQYLCLLHCFAGRFALDENLWQSVIMPSLSDFSERVVAKGKPLSIHLDTHHSIAFAFGYLLDSKCGVTTQVIQKIKIGTRIPFFYDYESEAFKEYINQSNWDFEEKAISMPSGNDVAVAISITHDVSDDVSDFVNDNPGSISKVIFAKVAPVPSPISIQNGNHILALVIQLVEEIKKRRNSEERKACLHFFIAAPNAFVFVLGQHIKALGKIKLYEYDFEFSRDVKYHQTFQLPF